MRRRAAAALPRLLATSLALAGVALAAAPAPARAQEHARVEIALPDAPDVAREGPTVASSDLLSDPKTHELLTSGFTTRVHYRLELWRRGGWFDDPKDSVAWDVLVSYDPTSKVYNVVRRQGTQLLESFGGFATLADAEAQFDRPYRVALHPTARGRYYYALTVEIETLSESDLNALQQWYRGPSSPGKGNVFGSLRSGVRTLLSRVLGGGKRRIEASTGIFSVPASP